MAETVSHGSRCSHDPRLRSRRFTRRGHSLYRPASLFGPCNTYFISAGQSNPEEPVPDGIYQRNFPPSDTEASGGVGTGSFNVR
jgi:hypothetical protein